MATDYRFDIFCIKGFGGKSIRWFRTSAAHILKKLRFRLTQIRWLLDDLIFARVVRGSDEGLVSLQCQCSRQHATRASDAENPDLELRVRFVWRAHAEHWGSTILRCHQLSRLLAIFDRRLDVKSVSISALRFSQDDPDLLVLHKSTLEYPFLDRFLRRLRERGTVVFLDLVDDDPGSSNWVDAQIDGYICSSHSELEYRRENCQNAFFVAHQVNALFRQSSSEHESFRVGYFGAPYNSLHLEELGISSRTPDFRLEFEVGQDLLEFLEPLSHHYSVRHYLAHERFKPGLKVYMASHLGATFIGSRADPESLALLGDDYPYLSTDSSVGEVRKTVAFAQETFGGEVHLRAKRKLEDLREEFCPARVVSDIQELIWKCAKSQG